MKPFRILSFVLINEETDVMDIDFSTYAVPDPLPYSVA